MQTVGRGASGSFLCIAQAQAAISERLVGHLAFHVYGRLQFCLRTAGTGSEPSSQFFNFKVRCAAAWNKVT